MTQKEPLTPEQVQRRNEWVKELRFGTRHQIRGNLRGMHDDGIGFCVLGVAADIRQTQGFYWDGSDLTLEEYNEDGYQCAWDTDLPVELCEEYGITIDESITIVADNDDGCLSFTELAEKIEAWTIDRKGV